MMKVSLVRYPSLVDVFFSFFSFVKSLHRNGRRRLAIPGTKWR